jgi:hypothetical protein
VFGDAAVRAGQIGLAKPFADGVGRAIGLEQDPRGFGELRDAVALFEQTPGVAGVDVEAVFRDVGRGRDQG